MRHHYPELKEKPPNDRQWDSVVALVGTLISRGTRRLLKARGYELETHLSELEAKGVRRTGKYRLTRIRHPAGVIHKVARTDGGISELLVSMDSEQSAIWRSIPVPAGVEVGIHLPPMWAQKQ